MNTDSPTTLRSADWTIDIANQHPELHHYTRWEGLAGIWQSQQLWATHFDQLNDPTEFLLIQDFLVESLMPVISKFAKSKSLSSSKVAKSIRKFGGIRSLARIEAANLISAVFDATTHTHDGHQFVTPHITSFCSHAKDKTYEQNNGLLSQWRGYGGVESFAIVFDTAELAKLIKIEIAQYNYIDALMLSAVYADDDFKPEIVFPKAVHGISTNWLRFMKDEKPDLEKYIEDIIEAGVRLKHRAFAEEREVRIVAFPIHPSYAAVRPNDPSHGKPTKVWHSIPRNHIKLFGSEVGSLPIKRIIVGPGEQQSLSVTKVRNLVGALVPVIPSATPFRQMTGTTP